MNIPVTIKYVNLIISALFCCCYAYQLFYILVPFFSGRRTHGPAKYHRYAVLIAARNEEEVLPHLIESIRKQDYPGELIEIFVVADNCTDETAAAAANCGAHVYQRFHRTRIGKGYALEFLLQNIYGDYGKEYFDGGVADPIPIEKAFELGCDKVVVIIPRPIEEKKHEHITLMKPFLKHYPAMLQKIEERPEIYNGKLEKLRHYQEEGKVILISPDSDKGLNMVSKNAERLDAYYKKGYSDAMTAVDKIREASRI